MPITFPNISIEEAKRQLQYQDRILRGFPEVQTVFGKVGRAESATDPAPITMVETTVQLRPPQRVAQEAPRSVVLELGARMAQAGVPSTLGRGATPHLGGADHRDERQDAVPGLDERLDDADQDARRHADHRRPDADRHQGLRHRSQRGGARRRLARAPDGADQGHAQRALRAEPRWPLPGHHPQARRAGALRPAYRRRRAGHRERHRRHADRHDDRRTQSVLDQRSLSPGHAQRHGVAAQRADPGWWRKRSNGRRRRHAHGDAGSAGSAGEQIGIRLRRRGRVAAPDLPRPEHGRYGQRPRPAVGRRLGNGAAAVARRSELDVRRPVDGPDG